MRQVHRAGEKTFIDFSGKRPTLVDRQTGELRRAELFVAVLGASGFTYAEATATQQLPDWVDAHVHMVEYFGGATALWVPDQLRSAIARPCRYEPDVNRTYEDLADHYGAVVVPARPRKPRDKAAAENSVLLVQRWILARLRDQTFFELGALNRAIRVLLDALNDRPLKKLGVSRRAPLRAARPPRPAAPAGHALRPRALEGLSRQHRLPRRVRPPPLQRALPTGPRAGRGPRHRRDRRSPLQGPARGVPPPPTRPPTVHLGRAHAERPPRPRRVDALEAHRLGREGRTRDRPARHPHPREPPPPRAGVPDRAGHHATGAAARRRPARRRERPRHRHRLVPLPHRQEHPRRRPGPPAPGAAGRDHPDAQPHQHP